MKCRSDRKTSKKSAGITKSRVSLFDSTLHGDVGLLDAKQADSQVL